MKTPRLNQENGMSATPYGQRGMATPDAPFQPKAPEGFGGTTIATPPIQPVSNRFPALERQEIIFTLFAPEAAKVQVAGNFNDWRPDATPLKNTGAGVWKVRLLLRSGQYEYRFVVDGRWREDSGAAQRAPNPYGEFNSALTVPLAVRTSIL